MQSKKFQRKIEDFVCLHCGAKVAGTGYTDHCPKCLWSLHVDINPGDRAAECRGFMEPMGLEIKSGEKIIHYQCQKCGFKHRVKAGEDDNFEAILELTGRGI
ncbi:MAG TPA: RNHCP domain-containing protein [Candidatus Portnoybacteria bacterium]|nr:RNHCP domain-containing protein [Candidatus Portnoybacteria bacterium]